MKQLSRFVRHAISAALLALPLFLTIPASALPTQTEPAADILPFVNAYLEALAAGRYDEAIEMTDFRGMANYLISRRLAELRAANPDITPEDEEKLTASFREKEVSMERLKTVAREMIEELKPQGMTWEIKQILRPDPKRNAYVVNYQIDKPGEQPRPATLGIEKIGPQWYVEPHLAEQLASANAPKPIPPPPSVVEFGNFFWNDWKNGDLEKAHNRLTDALKQRIPLLAFLENGQKLMTDLGMLDSWKLIFCGSVGADRMAVSYELTFTKGLGKSNIALLQTEQGWMIEGFQLQRVSPGAAPARPKVGPYK
ncbi:MAG TPA: hypothetical protein DCZ95_05390 [Verrucomicrobia bacterium]|nr:MAG: hypothetical protein A2X46_10315 [Lentisphaerae bacterium GWF2_57_35]HBA83512.1 hypothetical protein [Verrucomicrobiota bacterium]